MQPLASSRGRGIRLVPEPSSIKEDKACLVQHYISNPHTINGLKVGCTAFPNTDCHKPTKSSVRKL